MKLSNPLLLPMAFLHCGIYPSGKVAISWHLSFPQRCDHTIGKLSGNTGSLRSEVVKYSRPPDLKSPSNVCLKLVGLQGLQQTPAVYKHNAKYAKEYQAILLCLTPSKILAQEDTFLDVEPVRDWNHREILVKSYMVRNQNSFSFQRFVQILMILNEEN